MKYLVVLAIAATLTSVANAKGNFTGKCADAAANAVRASYGDAVAEGLMASVIRANVTQKRSVYEVQVAVMDGGGEPFSQWIDVTLDPKTCEVSSIEFSK